MIQELKYTENDFYDLDESSGFFWNSIVDYLSIEIINNLFKVVLKFRFPHRRDISEIRLTLTNLTSIYFIGETDMIGQQISSYKFLKRDIKYYLSLDPDESSVDETNEDNWVFVFTSLTAEIY